MKNRLLFLFLVSFAFVKCLVAQTYTVSGKVYSTPDGITQNPIVGALVKSQLLTSPWTISSTVTDAEGNYSITNVAPTTLMAIRVEKEGYTFNPTADTIFVMTNITNKNFIGIATAGNTPVPVTFYYKHVGSVPNNVFLAGSMNNYNPSDKNYNLTNQGNNIFTITVNLDPGDHVYKYVVDGNWVTDPYNPDTDGSSYNNSKITVADPMITYFLPAFNESYSSSSLPEIKAMVATNSNVLSLANYSLKINSNTITGTPVLSNNNRVITYIPSTAELQEGTNICELSFTAQSKTIAKTIQFQYTSGGGGGFSISGEVLSMVGIPLENVMINYGAGTVTTDAMGNYSITIKAEMPITLIPSKPGYSFVPDKISLFVNKNYENQNFMANSGGGGGEIQKIPYTITGRVTACSRGVANATVEHREKQYLTNDSGYYTITDTVEKNNTGMHSPYSASIMVTGDNIIMPRSIDIYFTGNYVMTQDITVYYIEDTITGTVTHANGQPFADMPLKWEMFQDKNITPIADSIIYTDKFGNFSAPFFYKGFEMPGSFNLSYKLTSQGKGYNFNNNIVLNGFQSCNALKNKNIVATFDTVPVCMVSVSDLNKNIVVWEKPETDVITDFKVYKESNVANVYEVIGTVSYNETAIFIDTTSDPSMKAYRYKIGTVTKFGYETALSNEHKTIHLTINKGVGNAWNLIWSHYEGINISTYKLYRGANKEDMSFITDIAGNLNSYTDNTAPTGDVYYQIEMVLPYACNPEVAKPLKKSAKADNIYASTKSNIVNSANATTGINVANKNNICAYPNPVVDVLYLTLDKNYPYAIYSIVGNLIMKGYTEKTIDVSKLKSGMYQLSIYREGMWHSYKFIKQ